jgi:hypothetical protein
MAGGKLNDSLINFWNDLGDGSYALRRFVEIPYQ